MGNAFFVRPWQSRMACVQNGLLQDLICQKETSPSQVGAVFKGRVRRLSKALNFAFVDIGLYKAGFLYGKDALNGRLQPLSKVLRPGKEILVQVKSDANREKGVRLSMNIALPGKILGLSSTAKGKERGFAQDHFFKRKRASFEFGFKTGERGTAPSSSAPWARAKSEKDFADDLKLLKDRWRILQKKVSRQILCGGDRKRTFAASHLS